MRTEAKTHIQNSVGRLIVSTLSFVLQIVWIFILAKKLTGYSTIITTFSSFLAIIVVIYLYNRRDTPSEFKAPWIILILAFPVAGLIIYLMFGHKKSAQQLRLQMEQLHQNYLQYLASDISVLSEIEAIDKGIANQCSYLYEKEGYPVYKNCSVQFYADTTKAYEDLIEDLNAANAYIFMEYHAIEDRVAFGQIKEILTKKAQEGVEVRLFYDDVGSIGFLNGSFARQMCDLGIKCKAFNRVSPAFRLYMNNRDHRKITVIDGKIAYTGGYNMADEYFHITMPYGHWNDTGIRFTGEAVNSILGTFLEIWNFTEKEPEDVQKFFVDKNTEIQEGFIQPYADNPLDNSLVGENVYLNAIKNSKDKLYLTTPYLIPSDAMIRELNMAAERGVDVRIFTPGIPDKKLVYRITRSYYSQLINSGVKIYEYSPGFLHGKQMLSDNDLAIVGTINLDYRSLYHHFENAVLMYKVDAINELNRYFEELIFMSNEVSTEVVLSKSLILRGLDCILRLIAPLL